jgi:hypothetical protein
MSKARRIRKISVFTSDGKFPVLTLRYINTALSQSAFRIYKCYIIIYFVYKVYIGFFNITYMHDWIVTVAQYIQYISFLKYSIFENMAV